MGKSITGCKTAVIIILSSNPIQVKATELLVSMANLAVVEIGLASMWWPLNWIKKSYEEITFWKKNIYKIKQSNIKKIIK